MQRPVKINFQNNTADTVDIFWTGPDGTTTLIVDDMPVGTELKDQPVSSLPNQLWTIEQKGEFFADFFSGNEPVQAVDLVELKTWFEPVEVTFANTTDVKLRVFFVDLDNQEIEYSKTPEGQIDPLAKNQALVTPANPLTRWVIRNDKEIVAESTGDDRSGDDDKSDGDIDKDDKEKKEKGDGGTGKSPAFLQPKQHPSSKLKEGVNSRNRREIRKKRT